MSATRAPNQDHRERDMTVRVGQHRVEVTRPGAPVAAPLDWAELDDPGLTARRWTLRDVDELLDRTAWRNPPRGHSAAAARRRLAALTESALDGGG